MRRLLRAASGVSVVFAFLGTLWSCGTPRTRTVAPMGGTGCTAATPSPSSKVIVLGVSLQELDSQFYHDIETGICARAAQLGYLVEIVDAARNGAEQNRQVLRFVHRKISAIIVAPYNASMIDDAIVQANLSHVPVFTVDIADAGKKGKIVAHVTSDNQQGGALAGMMMCHAVSPNAATVAILDVGGPVSSVQDRVRSFRESLAAHCNATIVDDDPRGGERAASAAATMDILQRYAHLAGIFAINDDSAIGASRAVDRAQLTGSIAIIGYDATPEAREAIAAGAMYGDVVQHPEQLGSAAVDAVHDYLEGRTPQRVVPVDVDTFVKDDVGK